MFVLTRFVLADIYNYPSLTSSFFASIHPPVFIFPHDEFAKRDFSTRFSELIIYFLPAKTAVVNSFFVVYHPRLLFTKSLLSLLLFNHQTTLSNLHSPLSPITHVLYCTHFYTKRVENVKSCLYYSLWV